MALRTWVVCGLMALVVVWPGAVPALAVCVGADHDAHVVLLGTHHDESVPHEHQHGSHWDMEVAGCCGGDRCLDVPLAFLLDGSHFDPSGCSRLALPVGDVWYDVLGENQGVTPVGLFVAPRCNSTNASRMNC